MTVGDTKITYDSYKMLTSDKPCFTLLILKDSCVILCLNI